MNEIKQIHLGRQAFTIALDAHSELRKYLDAIKKSADSEVVNEIELRMAELLTERGVSTDKVVVASDIDFLKEQLGKPQDFKENSDEDASSDDDGQQPKRLYRDTENGMVAGVASGLGAFFGIDAIFIRLALVLLTFAGGSGILVYIVLWLLVPEVKSPSDRLQMQGRAVTVEALKDLVDRADVSATAKRAGGTIKVFVEALLKLALIMTGVVFVVSSLFGLLWTVVATTTLLINPTVISSGVTLFPVGNRENILLGAATVVAVVSLLFLLFAGLALIRRKWLLPVWAVSAMLAVCFVGAGLGTALGIDAAPRIRQRFETASYKESRPLQAFTKVVVTGEGAKDVDVEYEAASEYGVKVDSFGVKNTAAIQSKLEGNTLTITVPHLEHDQKCTWFCLQDGDVTLTIYAPNVDLLEGPKGIKEKEDFYENGYPATKSIPAQPAKPAQPSLPE